MTPPGARPATLLALLLVFSKLGLSSFGGGLSGWMLAEVVEKRRWMTEDQFLAGVAMTQAMPGPNSVNLAMFIGQRLRGGAGLAAAGFGVLFPPFVFILVLAALYGQVSGSAPLRVVLSGMAAAGVGMNVVTGWRTARRMRGLLPAGIALLLFVGVGVLALPMAGLVLAVAPLSIWLSWRGMMGD